MPPTMPPTTPPIGFQPLIRRPPNAPPATPSRMLRIGCLAALGKAAATKVGRNSIVRNRTDDCQRDRARAAISQHSLVQTLRVRHELLGLPVGANPKTPLPKLEQRSLFCFRHGSAKSQLANDFVIGLLVIRPELFAQSIRFSLEITKLNPGRRRQCANRTAASIAMIIILVFHDEKLIRKVGIKEVPDLESGNQESKDG